MPSFRFRLRDPSSGSRCVWLLHMATNPMQITSSPLFVSRSCNGILPEDLPRLLSRLRGFSGSGSLGAWMSSSWLSYLILFNLYSVSRPAFNIFYVIRHVWRRPARIWHPKWSYIVRQEFCQGGCGLHCSRDYKAKRVKNLLRLK